jgi:hypothetical protein
MDSEHRTPDMSGSTKTQPFERRRHERFPSFIRAELNDQPVTVLDVSLGGLGGTVELRGDATDLPAPGEEARISLLPDEGAPVTLTLEVVRVDADLNLFGARIVEMGEAEFEFMKRLFAERTE